MQEIATAVEKDRVGDDGAGRARRALHEERYHLLHGAGAVEEEGQDRRLVQAVSLLLQLFNAARVLASPVRPRAPPAALLGSRLARSCWTA